DARVGLAQRRRRQTYQPQAAMRDRRREADRVEHRAAADDDDVTAPIEVGRLELLEHVFEQMNVVLDRLAAGDDLDRACSLAALGMSVDDLAQSLGQIGPGGGN